MPTSSRVAVSNRTSLLLCAVAFLAGMGGSPAAQSQSPSVREYLAYQLQPSGSWQRDNPDFAPGNGQPKLWERVMTVGPGPETVIADAFAVTEAGVCQPIAHIVYWWDAETGRVATDNYAAGNVRFSGGLVLADGQWVIEAEGRLPDGSTVKFRDMPGFERPNEYSTIGHRWTGSAWEAGDEAIWRRVNRSACSSDRPE